MNAADLGIVNFVLVQSTTVSLAYSIDSYRPIGSEVVAMQLALKGQCPLIPCPRFDV